MSAKTCANLVLGTAGHIDHGKSTLVQALTGTNPDRLAEEKRRGITIELGFAQVDLPGGVSMGVVDVPGHERFIRHMIAGSTGIDLALLCIAADDGIMPQTLEHLAVLELLGIERCVVALTKADLVDAEWVSFVADEVRMRLEHTPYAQARIVAVSARTGAGLDELRTVLAEETCGLGSATQGSTTRLPIDRVFSIKGAGTVITGTLWSGTISPGSELEALPQGGKARVREVQIHGEAVDQAGAGNRVALNLAALGVGDVKPGMFLVEPGTVESTERFDAQVSYLGSGVGAEPLVSGTSVRIAHGTAEVPGRILFMDGMPELGVREHSYAQIRLDEPLPVMLGDRFVIRSLSPARVIGGGRVLHAHPRRRTNLKPGEQNVLDALLAHDEDAACTGALMQMSAPATASEVARIAGIAEASARHSLETRVANGALERLGAVEPPYYASRAIVQKQEAALENALLRFHAEQASAPGITKGALLDRLPGKLSAPCLDALLDHALAQGRIVYADGLIGHPQAAGGARKREEQAAHALLEALAAANVTPPSIAELMRSVDVEPPLGHRALSALEKEGALVRVNGDLAFEATAFSGLEQTAVAFLCAHGAATAAELKDAMGVSRKYAIPVLEYFDARGITKRVGDMRELGPKHTP